MSFLSAGEQSAWTLSCFPLLLPLHIPGLHWGIVPQSTGCVVLDKNMEMLATMFRDTSWSAPFSSKWVPGHASLPALCKNREKKRGEPQLFQEIQYRVLKDGKQNSYCCFPILPSHLQHPPFLIPVLLLKHSWMWNNQNWQKDTDLPLIIAMPKTIFSSAFLHFFAAWLYEGFLLKFVCVSATKVQLQHFRGRGR